MGEKAHRARIIREIHGKLINRAEVRGLVVSMSGFTKGAIKQVEDYTKLKTNSTVRCRGCEVDDP
jgi:hypothetical protein